MRVLLPGGMVRASRLVALIAGARSAMSSAVSKLMAFGGAARPGSVGLREWHEPQRRSTMPRTTVKDTWPAAGAGAPTGEERKPSATTETAKGAAVDSQGARAGSRRSYRIIRCRAAIPTTMSKDRISQLSEWL